MDSSVGSASWSVSGYEEEAEGRVEDTASSIQWEPTGSLRTGVYDIENGGAVSG